MYISVCIWGACGERRRMRGGDAEQAVYGWCSCDRRRAEGHDLLIEELLELFAADVVLVH